MRRLLPLLLAASACGPLPTKEEERSQATATTTEAAGPTDGGSCGKTHPKVGRTGQLSTRQHGVRGKVTFTDDCTITLSEFHYDGGGVDVRAYGAKGGAFAGGGFAIGPQLLRQGQPYVDATVLLTLPEGKTLDDLDSLSIWCVAFNVSFGDTSL